MKTQTTKALVLVAIAAGFALAGCELIVDFDRTKIPVEVVDSGTADATIDGEVILGDGSVAPSLDAGEDAGDASEPVDAGGDAGDGG